MGTCGSRWLLAWGNLSLIQGQALVVASIATITSVILNLMGGHHIHWSHVLLIGASSMSAASLASALLSSIMIIIVILSQPLQINPDNVATPIAASLGDLVTLCILSGISLGLYSIKGNIISVVTLMFDHY